MASQVITHPAVGLWTAEPHAGRTGPTPFKSADGKSAWSKKQGSLGPYRTGEGRGVVGNGCMWVRGRFWGEVGSQGTSVGSPVRQRRGAWASSRRNVQGCPGSLILSLCLSLSYLFTCGSICCLTVGLGFARIPGEQVE